MPDANLSSGIVTLTLASQNDKSAAQFITADRLAQHEAVEKASREFIEAQQTLWKKYAALAAALGMSRE